MRFGSRDGTRGRPAEKDTASEENALVRAAAGAAGASGTAHPHGARQHGRRVRPGGQGPGAQRGRQTL